MASHGASQLRVGLVGCGHISAAHLRGWASSAATVTGVFDRDRDAAARRAREFGIATVYERMEQLLEASDVVDVCTPPHTHAQILEAAVRSGRHLLVEKPVVIDLADWERLRELRRSSPSRLCVVHHLKYARSVERARRWIAAGRVGRLLRLDWRFMTHPDRDRMLTAEPHWSHQLPGGRWFETLPHNLYLIHHLAGEMKLSGVTALRSPTAPPGVRADEIVVTLAGQQGLASLHFSAACRVNRREAAVVGSRGVIQIDLLSNLATISRTGDRRRGRLLGRPTVEAASSLAQAVLDRPAEAWRRLLRRSPHTLLIRDFARSLVDGAPSPTPDEEIDFVVRNCHAIGRAIDAALP